MEYLAELLISWFGSSAILIQAAISLSILVAMCFMLMGIVDDLRHELRTLQEIDFSTEEEPVIQIKLVNFIRLHIHSLELSIKTSL